MKRASLAMAILAALGCPEWARAQDAEAERFAHGVALYQRGDYQGALTEFQAVYELSPAPTVVYNLARTLEHLGRIAACVERYGEFLDAGAPGMAAAAREELVGRVRTLRAGLAELTVQGQPGLFVTANGVPMGTLPAVLTLDPGSYVIEAGHARDQVTLGQGERKTILLHEPGGGGAPGGPGSGSGTGGASGTGTGGGAGTTEPRGSDGGGKWVALGIGGAAVVTMIVTGVLALGEASEADDLAAMLDRETDPDRREDLARDGLDANRTGRTLAIVSDLALLAAVVSGGVFVYLLTTSGDPEQPEVRAGVAPLSDGALVTARARW